MKCPHCLVAFHADQTLWSVSLSTDSEGWWLLERRTCPGCRKFILSLKTGRTPTYPDPEANHVVAGYVGAQMQFSQRARVVWPTGIMRASVPAEVPPGIAEDYKEACLVLSDSPKASAALSRRCLQNLLRQAANVEPGDLSVEIQQVLDGGKLPSAIADNIDAVRNIGNFAAHPNKSTSTGEVVPVEPEEAEWNLDVLESLFDFYFVQPVRAKKKKEALNKKLADAKKPPMK